MENAGDGCAQRPSCVPARSLGWTTAECSGLSSMTPQPMLLYPKEPVAATPDVLAMAAPLRPTEVFRLSATCATHKCPHFDGADCQLATRIVTLRPPAVDALPPCIIRKDCRWFSQEGGAACLRCPQVTTVTYDCRPRRRRCQDCRL